MSRDFHPAILENVSSTKEKAKVELCDFLIVQCMYKEIEDTIPDIRKHTNWKVAQRKLIYDNFMFLWALNGRW